MLARSAEMAHPSQYLGLGGVIHPKTGNIYIHDVFSVISFVGDYWNDSRSLSDLSALGLCPLESRLH